LIVFPRSFGDLSWHVVAVQRASDPPGRLDPCDRRAIGSCWRRLDPGRQALLVLAHLPNGDTYARLAAGFGVGLATVWRYVREAVDLLAAHAPSLTAARIHSIIARAAKADVDLLADKGYQGAGGTVTVPSKGRKPTREQKAHNRMVNSVRGPGERGFATLKAWRILTKIRCCPQRVAPLAKAVLTLELGPES
jgi:hypothetical protein